ncbi:MAG: TetR/AcrR family transcriptional regulator [Acidimicrobiia bacterium]
MSSRATRQDSQVHTRRRIVDAGAAVFAGHGFGGATVTRIAEEAGFTIGAVYSNFAGKEDLFLAVVDEHLETNLDGATRALQEAPTLEEAARDLGSGAMTFLEANPDRFLLFVEAWAFALRDAGFRPRFTRRQADSHRVLTEALAGRLAREGLATDDLPVAHAALALKGLFHGIAFERATNPGSVSPDALASAATLILRSLSAAAPGTRRRRGGTAQRPRRASEPQSPALPASRGRFTRHESQEITRGRIVEAAASIFARRGYRAATVAQIAEEAGFTVGAVYSNFAGKEDLFLAVADERLGEQLEDVARVLAAAPTLEDVAHALGTFGRDYLRANPDWFPLFVEAWAFARRDATFGSRFAQRQANSHHVLAEALAVRLAQECVVLDAPPVTDIALAFKAVYNGIAIEQATNPGSVPDDALPTICALLLGGLTRVAGGPGR